MRKRNFIESKQQSFVYDETHDNPEIHTITTWLILGINKVVFEKLNMLPFENKFIILMRYMAKLRKSDISRLLSIDADKVEPAIYDSLIKLLHTFDSFDSLLISEGYELKNKSLDELKAIMAELKAYMSEYEMSECSAPETSEKPAKQRKRSVIADSMAAMSCDDKLDGKWKADWMWVN